MMRRQEWVRANWDRFGAWICVAVGVLVLFLGWQGVSRQVYPASQLPYVISGGIGGALLIAFGATLLISADLRDEWQKLDEIASRLPSPAAGPDGTSVQRQAPAVERNGCAPEAAANHPVGQVR